MSEPKEVVEVSCEKEIARAEFEEILTKKIVATHSGCFHSDEVLAVYMLVNHVKEFVGAEILRTRKKEKLDKADIVVDVGGEFEPERYRFDHHQKTFTETWDDKHTTKLSSAGLIFKYFGTEILRSIIAKLDATEERLTKKLEWDDEQMYELRQRVYDKFFEPIDADDNGISFCEGEKPKFIPTDVPQIVSLKNPQWNEPNDDALENRRFREAMDAVGDLLCQVVRKIAYSDMPCRTQVKEAMEKRYTVHESGKIIELDGFMPFKTYLYELENEMKVDPILFAIYPNRGLVKVHCVSVEPKSFVNRLGLHPEWRGLESETIEEKSGIKDVVFVHGSGFMGANKTRDGAIAMCVESMNANQQ